MSALIFHCAAAPVNAYWSRNRTIKPKEGKPAVAFTGTVKQIITNALPYKIVVDGSSNATGPDAPKGSVTFDVQATCNIMKSEGTGAGTFADIKVGQKVSVGFFAEGAGQFEAQSVTLTAKPATSKKSK